MLSFTKNLAIFGSNAEKTEYLAESEIAVHQRTIFRRLTIIYFTGFIQ